MPLYRIGDTAFYHFVNGDEVRIQRENGGPILDVPVDDLVEFVQKKVGSTKEQTIPIIPSTSVGALHVDIMGELEKEYEGEKGWHCLQRKNDTGIRSSQISALVMLLIKKGVLK